MRPAASTAISGCEASWDDGRVLTLMPRCQACVPGSWTLTKTRAWSASCGGSLTQITAAQPAVGWTAMDGERSAPGMLLKSVSCVVVSMAGRGVGRTQAAVAAPMLGDAATTGAAAGAGSVQAVRYPTRSTM